MPRATVLAGASTALVLLALSAVAADKPNAANLSTQQDSRSITLQNRSGSDITQAQVRTTDGRVWNLGHGGVSSNHGSDMVVPARDCIAAISVELKNGRKLQVGGLHACDNTQIVVSKSGISIPQLAVPGAARHATPR
ncbi:MAG: hypothetical protein WBQ75_23680 [Acetobacteraceae bacterium]